MRVWTFAWHFRFLLNKNKTNINFHFQFKTLETTKASLELQVKGETNKLNKMEKELDRIKVERIRFETKAQAVEAELAVS